MATPIGSGGRKLDCKDLHGYLRTLSPNILDRLYNHPATCLAVFRELPSIAKQYVMRILFVDQPLPQAVVASWVITGHQQEHIQSTRVLSDLRVWHDHPIPGGLPGWLLNPTYRVNLKIALLGGGEAWASAGHLGPDKYARDVQFLDTYALERWECVLHFLVGSKGVDKVSSEVALVLTNSGLMKVSEDSGNPVISQAGFQFLLMDTPSQVWFFMLQYLETAETRGLDLVEALNFLFQLSFSTLGKDYSTENMNESQLQFLQVLRELGLVYQRKRKSKRYYPTRIAINIASGLSDISTDVNRPGFIMVETNYRVYAYTDSDLQIEILGLFSELLYRFPNLTVGALTRESVTQAASNGITAEQILHYLRTHAHPEMLQNTPIIPPTLSDQIRLWELERDRMTFSDGVLYSQFLSQADFELLRDYARDLGVLVWENPSRRVLIVSPSGHDEVRRFWKKQKKGGSS
ncbi:general transcription factor IIH subunit 4-like [Ptychodera flava]|uniref:general transcription factor IIH subunit 4-like n=1 Tax=Ptychodera flava TaxID=63121 RepID=UPI00396AA58E